MASHKKVNFDYTLLLGMMKGAFQRQVGDATNQILSISNNSYSSKYSTHQRAQNRGTAHPAFQQLAHPHHHCSPTG